MAMLSRSIDIPPQWESAAREAATCRGAVMVIGAVDTGKSTLVHYLTAHLLRAGINIALEDCDLGQTTVGPPTTVGMACPDSNVHDQAALHPLKMCFMGSTTPAEKIRETIAASGAMVQYAIEQGADFILVDTDGMVEGYPALKLRSEQITLARPAMILALQRENELEPLLSSLPGIVNGRLMGLPSSALARSKTYAQRR